MINETLIMFEFTVAKLTEFNVARWMTNHKMAKHCSKMTDATSIMSEFIVGK
jgi:hypothetical protein